MIRAGLVAAWLLVVSSLSAHAEPPPRPIVGPAQVCLKQSRFSLIEGEQVLDVQAGVHGVDVEISSPQGSFTLSERDVVRSPRRGRIVRRQQGADLYRVRGPSIQYAGVVQLPRPQQRYRSVVLIEGAALQGDGADARIYDRLRLGDTSDLNCEFYFRYGFELFLPK